MNTVTSTQALEALESLHDLPGMSDPRGAYETLRNFIQQSTPRKLEGGNFSHEEVYAYTGTLPPERIEQVLAELEKAQHRVAKLEYEIDGMVEQDDYDIMKRRLSLEVDELQSELGIMERAISEWLSHGFDPAEAKELLGIS